VFVGAAVITVVGLTAACHEGILTASDDEELGTSRLIVWDANPPDGNGKLASNTMTIGYYTKQGVQDLDKVTISASDAEDAIGHELEIYWLPATTEVRLCQHFWTPVGGATSGSTRCASGTANVCDPTTVEVDPTQKIITFHGTVLADMFGGDATSRLTGTIAWEGGALESSDH
jgi:hypothetical protein